MLVREKVNKDLTNSSNYGTIKMLTKDADFLCQQRPLIHVKETTVSLVSRGERGFLLEEIMPKGVYKRSQEHIEKMKEKIKEFSFKKGHKPWSTGKHHSLKTRKKMSKSHEGKIPWNKDKKLPQTTGEKSPLWRGGRYKTKNGYIFIRNPQYSFNQISRYDRYIFEHRFIIEKQIGRRLLPKEHCHHLGETDDNRPHMLMAFTSNSAHQRFHRNPDKVKPKEIIFDGRKINKSIPNNYVRIKRSWNKGLRTKKNKICKLCGHSFYPKRPEQIYCGKSCSTKSRHIKHALKSGKILKVSTK